MKHFLLSLLLITIISSSIAQINYSITVLQLKAKADDCDGGAPFCLNAPQDPIFNIWVSDQGGNESTYCWIFEEDESADYNLWIDIQNAEVANETNVNTSTITIEMSGFETDALFSATCSSDSGDDAIQDRQLAQQFDLSSIPHDTPFTTTVDIADTYYAQVEIHWVDLSANVNELSSNTFNVFPNPSNGQFTVQSDLGLNTTLQIIDLSGRTVQTIDNVNSSQQIDLTGIDKGTYHGVLTHDNKRITQKCMILIQ